MRQQSQHGGVIRALAVHGQRAEMALPKLHLDKRIGQRPEPHAAMLGWDEGQPEALRPGFLAQVRDHLVERFAVGQAFLGRDTLILHPLPDPRTDLFCIIWNYKIDRHGGLLLIWFCIWRVLERLLEDPLIVALLGWAGIAAVGKVVQGIFDDARTVR